jgi:hypothetical protein
MSAFATTTAAITIWATLLVASRALLLRFEFDPWTFTFVQMVAGGLTLILLSMGPRGTNTPSKFLRVPRVSTFILGLLRVMSASSFTAALVHVTVTQATVIGAISVTMASLSVWWLFERKPANWEWLGHGLILGLVATLIPNLEGGWRNPAILLLVFNEICVVGSSLLAERHPDNQLRSPQARIRFTGTILLMTAGLLLGIRMIEQVTALNGAEWIASLSFELVVSGILVGIVLRAPAMFFSFWSLRQIGAQNYMAAAASLPLLGLGFEEIAEKIGMLPQAYDPGQLTHAVLVELGCLMILAARWHGRQKVSPGPPIGRTARRPPSAKP